MKNICVIFDVYSLIYKLFSFVHSNNVGINNVIEFLYKQIFRNIINLLLMIIFDNEFN